MSTPQHPVGRRSPAVYRRRRLMVVLVLVAIVVLVVLAIARPWRGSAGTGGAPASVPAAATASPGPTVSGSAAATSSPQPTASSTATATAAPKPSATPASADSPCNPSNIDVEAITDASSYGPTQRPLLSLSLTNTGSQACTIDAGTAAMVFTISSGSDQWWTSTDCQTDPVHTVIKLEPKKTLTSVPIPWDRTRSSKTTCSSTSRPVAPAGGASYHLAVAVDGIASKTTKQFVLN